MMCFVDVLLWLAVMPLLLPDIIAAVVILLGMTWNP